jgi:hypothetical protein
MKSKILGEETVGGLKLRPWTLATRKFLMALMPDIDSAVSESELQRQIVSLAWMQSNDPKFVDECIKDKTAEEKISEFENEFPLQAFPAVTEWAARHAKAIQDAVVTVVPKPDSKPSKDNPPKN